MSSMENALGVAAGIRPRPYMTVVEGGPVGQVIALANQKGGLKS